MALRRNPFDILHEITIAKPSRFNPKGEPTTKQKDEFNKCWATMINDLMPKKKESK